ncbi:MFS transporter [Cytophagaceae bacterium DM2B3-1]|uniref:MFS transporter n=1 Tax=Xanthocytophaga flava TaxID=3048013 RepID=A0AAE3UA49_9BACT|nr:MFS transporter [Xanthocytophaga flavus]MDJ1471490.1 MFS transporter [Xanthocytophaga flavus]MDJ1485146.1 MFS transporter [Xanthocytophaga flavus]MDJ1496661.1 MFS transporter [Xanthocytophaga flavus]
MSTSINKDRLFIASCMALITTAMAFGIRAGVLDKIGTQYGITPLELGYIVGTAFWGFTLGIIFGGPLCDFVGMKRLIYLAFFGHLIGIIMTIFSTSFWSFYISTLFVGVANGLVEAVCNPLVTSLYTNNKTQKLHQFHLWFPGGILISTLIVYLLSNILNLGWQVQIATMLIPNIAYGIMFWGQEFPPTERVAAGVSNNEMVKASISPLFIFMVICMFLTATTEFGPNNWIPTFLKGGSVPSILLLTGTTLVMVICRAFAGNFIHKFENAWVLLFSAVVSALGIWMISKTSGNLAFVASLVFGAGVSFFWPTMLGFVSENIPKTGALGLAVMGGAGMLAQAFALPIIGDIYANLQEAKVASGLSTDAAQLEAGMQTLQYITIIPLFLIAAFTGLVIYKKRNSTVKQQLA